jgi:hypothetical protein
VNSRQIGRLKIDHFDARGMRLQPPESGVAG